MTILNSSDPTNTRAFVEMAIASKKPHYIRIEKEKFSDFPGGFEFNDNAGYSSFGNRDSKLAIITTGITGQIVFSQLEKWTSEFKTSIRLIDVYRIKPFPNLLSELKGHTHIVVVDETYKSIVGSNISSLLLKINEQQLLLIADTGELFQFLGSTREFMTDFAGLSPVRLERKIALFLGQN